MHAAAAPKSHHYVPASYLARFADDEGYVFVEDRVRSQIRRQRPKKLMKIGAYYRQRWVPLGIDPNILEISLGSGLEDIAKTAIDQLTQTGEPLGEDDAAAFLMYVEFQRIRVPRQAAQAMEMMRTSILNCLSPDLLKQMREEGFQLSMKDSARFDYMRMVSGTIYPWLCRMEWEVVSAEQGSSFLTSDSPVSFFNPQIMPPAEAGLGLAGTVVLYPLSSMHLLIMRHAEGRTLDALDVLPVPEDRDYRIAIQHGRILGAAGVRCNNSIIHTLAHELVAGRDPGIFEFAAPGVAG